ncbi:hypothetical protein [Alteribacter keqinensis]|uniref:Uncharacterized protein n=1 Tax=Alteribacter keqinensis TaxID=2483800 RepID=A0A3M7TNG1_9BACI|nr:hypothetical protein [Alteribacter keqinensis]RNA66992.1 hypothetical protein EBO34_17515 [Alteribacter keqinensis]
MREAGTKNKPTWMLVVGYINALIALLLVPILFGGLGILFGYLYKKHDPKQGKTLMIVAGAAIVIGALIGGFTYMMDQ